jgi:hypothetical protein
MPTPKPEFVASTQPKPLPATVAAKIPTPSPAKVMITETELIALEKRVREECRSTVTVTELEMTKAGRLIVKFVAANEAIAEQAAKELSQLPDLKKYTVEFEATLVQR